MNYFLIPGNPPAIHFYQLWASEIRSLRPGSATHVSAYPQLADERDAHRAMEEILQSHLQTLNVFYQRTRSPITIIGHSLGGHFALRLLQERTEWIKQVVLVHPFLRKPSIEGQVVLKTAALLSKSPSLLRLALLTKKSLRPAFPELHFVTDEELLNAALIARHENTTIARDQSPCVVEDKHKSKINLLHTRKDWWCRSQVIAELAKSIRVQECREPHGFITNGHHRLSILKKIL